MHSEEKIVKYGLRQQVRETNAQVKRFHLGIGTAIYQVWDLRLLIILAIVMMAFFWAVDNGLIPINPGPTGDSVSELQAPPIPEAYELRR